MLNKGIYPRALNYTLSSSCGNFNRSISSYALVTNFDISITTTNVNSAVRIELISDGTSGSGNHSGISESGVIDGIGSGFILLERDTTGAYSSPTTLGEYRVTEATFPSNAPHHYLPGSFFHFDIGLSPNTYHFRIQAREAGSGTIAFDLLKMLIYEIPLINT